MAIIGSFIRILIVSVAILAVVPKVDGHVDSLRQIWTDIAQPDSLRFDAIKEYYKRTIFAHPDSVILLTSYHIDLAEQKKLESQKGFALSRKGVAHNIMGDSESALIALNKAIDVFSCLLYTSPSPRDQRGSRMPSSA